MQEHIQQVTRYCILHLPDINDKILGDEYYYSSLPLCVIDSVFSIGVRYEGVKNTIRKVCDYFEIDSRARRKGTLPKPEDQISVSSFLELLSDQPSDALAEKVYQNRQRTSVKNGILKAEAVTLFLKVLKDFGVESFQDVPRLINNNSFEFCIRHIPGQRSGISLKYFFMLAGSDDLIKPDRMIVRFLEQATGTRFKLDQCQTILSGVARELKQKGVQVTPKLLDNMIWNYQRNA